jgi:hypothetical protein
MHKLSTVLASVALIVSLTTLGLGLSGQFHRGAVVALGQPNKSAWWPVDAGISAVQIRDGFCMTRTGLPCPYTHMVQ